MTLSSSALADLRELACLGVSLMLVSREERQLHREERGRLRLARDPNITLESVSV